MIAKAIEDDKFKKENYIILSCIKNILKYLNQLGIIEIFHRFICVCLKYPFYKWNFLKSDKIMRKNLQNDKDILIILSLLVLLILLFSPFYQYSWRQSIVSFFIIWRLAEILVYQLSVIFLSKGNGITSVSFPRSIALFLINVSEVITVYAILYLSLGAIGYCYNNQEIQKPFEALYFSIITISTTGFGDIIPINRCGRILVFSEIAVGILLLVIFFGILVGRWKSNDDRFDQLLRKVYKQQKKKMKP
jgi:hypothetical protein